MTMNDTDNTEKESSIIFMGCIAQSYGQSASNDSDSDDQEKEE